jgi:hypothetical protein
MSAYPDLLRVDVAGVAVMVRGDVAREHLENVNRDIAKMKMALHRISKMHPAGPGAGNVARETLNDLTRSQRNGLRD